jgi:hypothetical protein
MHANARDAIAGYTHVDVLHRRFAGPIDEDEVPEKDILRLRTCTAKGNEQANEKGNGFLHAEDLYKVQRFFAAYKDNETGDRGSV